MTYLFRFFLGGCGWHPMILRVYLYTLCSGLAPSSARNRIHTFFMQSNSSVPWCLSGKISVTLLTKLCKGKELLNKITKLQRLKKILQKSGVRVLHVQGLKFDSWYYMNTKHCLDESMVASNHCWTVWPSGRSITGTGAQICWALFWVVPPPPCKKENYRTQKTNYFKSMTSLMTKKAKMTGGVGRGRNALSLSTKAQSFCTAWFKMKACADFQRYNYYQGEGVIKVRIIYLKGDKKLRIINDHNN